MLNLKAQFAIFGSMLLVIILISSTQFDAFNEPPYNTPNVENMLIPPKMSLSIIESIRRDCGALCDTDRPGTPGPYFDHVTAPINCPAIFKNEYIDRGHGLHPAPREIPKDMYKDFTMNYRLNVIPWYFDQQYLGSKARTPVWTKEGIDNGIAAARRGVLGGNYGASETNALRDGMAHAPGIKNGRVLVIGSENPWVESCVLEQGAREVVTLEYGKIESKHPQVKTLVPYEFRMKYLNGSLGLFDAVVTFSSVEHSGLGRYGDGLNPWGDIIAIARAWCVTKNGGSLTIGVMYDNEKDYIRYNAGRWYGKLRYPYLATNWKQHYRGTGIQRVHVFTKGERSESNNSHTSQDEKIKAMIEKVRQVKRDCGELCDTDRKGTPGPYFDHITSPINCKAIFKCEYCDSSHGINPAPRKIPPELYKDFTMNYRLNVSDYYFNQQYLGSKARTPVWSKAMIDGWVAAARKGSLGGNYGASETNALRDGMSRAPGIKNGRVLVIGSENPWVEAAVLEQGAREVVTLEYGKIESQHPQVKTLVPDEFRKSYLNNTLGKFDAIVTFSSLEHSGLGRYGDALNPWGDIIALARGWCVTKNGGSLTIGVMYDNEKDYIRFNAGRWYGKIRYPYLATNWRQHYRGVGIQRVHVFTKGEYKGDESVKETTESETALPTLDEALKKPNPYAPFAESVDRRYSQAGQDFKVYTMRPKENGFFIEMGAYDGKGLSNTLWLERKHNWTGLLIEANPKLCSRIDTVNRRAWRLCGCISTQKSATFIMGEAVGAVESDVDQHHIKLLNHKNTVSVPCFTLKSVLDKINVHHIDYFSLDVEGSEPMVLASMREELVSRKIIVDIWTIEYRVWDGSSIIHSKGKENLEKLRKFFKEIGGYVEHSQISYEQTKLPDGHTLDVSFVYIESWCKDHDNKMPDGSACSS